MAKAICKIEDCPDPAHSRGWCKGHYDRWLRHGDPEGGLHFYRLDSAFFDCIDTEAKAYWLGFITADGCIGTGHHVNRLSVKLMQSDAGHLEKLKTDLVAEHPIHRAPRRGVAGASAAVFLSSRPLVQALAQLGVTSRKSGTVRPWRGPDELMRHYWRGMFDGDGCLSRASAREIWSLTLCGSEPCILAFAEWARPICRSTSEPYFHSNIWYWKTGGLAAPQALARALYEDAAVYLDRKRELALQLMDKPILSRSWRGQQCTKPGCQAEASVKAMCQTHYTIAWRAAADLPECTIDDCHEKQLALGYCQTHWQRNNKHGDPLRVDQSREGARRYALDQAYFDEIDTKAKARWLGFIAATGSVVRSTKSFRFCVELDVRNESFLVRLRDALGSNKPLRYRSGKKAGDLVALSVDSWRVTEALERHGVTTRDGMTVTPWCGPDDLLPHYRQGFAEGKSITLH